MKRGLLHVAAGILAAGLAAGTASAQTPAPAPANLPDYLAGHHRHHAADAGRARDAGRPAAQHLDVRALRQRRQDLPGQHPGQASAHPGAVLGRRRTHDPLPAGQAAGGGAVGADRLPDHEVDRPQHHGDLRGGHALRRQRRRQELDGADARLPHADEDGARRRRHPAHPGRLEARREEHPGQQRRLHGRLPGQGRDHDGGAAGLRQEAGAGHQAHHQLGGLDPGQALDGRDRRVEGEPRRRLGQDLRRRQHDLRRAPEQRPVQRARAVFPAPRRSTTG